MTGNTCPVSELTFNELQAADIVLSYDGGAGEHLYRDGITGREMSPAELIPVPDLAAASLAPCLEAEPEAEL
jgi:hypothetical protein